MVIARRYQSKLIGRLSPTTTIYEVAIEAKCSHCGTKGAVGFRLHYVCKIQGND